MVEAPIQPADWEAVVRSVPVVSVDLLVLDDGALLLGKRTNEPAKHEWFPPGGTVFKHESLTDAAHRIAKQELGTDVRIDRRLGVYEHFYETADVPDTDGKHYVAVAYVGETLGEPLRRDGQHSVLHSFAAPRRQLNLHPYVARYVEELDEFD